MHIQEVKVTPELAQKWLSEVNASNRSLSHHSVKRYAADMSSGNWMRTHQNAIAFYEDGDLADGQHRLAAVVRSGVTLPMMVAYGLPREASKTIDQGRARKMSDVLTICGALRGGKYASSTVAILNVIRRAEGYSSGVATTSEMERALTQLSDGIEFSHVALTRSRGRLMSAPTRAALCAGYYAYGPDAVANFAEVYCTGMPASRADETVIVFRNRVLTDPSASGGAAHRDMFYKMALRFLRAHSEDRVVKVARAGDELIYRTGAFDA